MTIDVVILAAGKGTRMYSSIPKVLHEIGGKPMLAHVIAAAAALNQTRIHTVIGYGADKIKQYFLSSAQTQELNWVLQEQQLGTGHAVKQALPALDASDPANLTLVLYGDVPLITTATLQALISLANSNSLALLTLQTPTPFGLGRIIRDTDGRVCAIVEEKDATPEQRTITEINSGIMAIPTRQLERWLQQLGNNNKQAEYYLTDIIAMACDEGCAVEPLVSNDAMELQGVNDKTQLASLERHYQMHKTEMLMQAGVTLRDPARVDIRGELSCGHEVVIDVNTLFEGTVVLGDGVVIEANTIIKDAQIGANTRILAGSNIDGAIIGARASVGPYARLRPGTVLADEVKIGNFVETKNATLGKGSKASHLAYLGDAEIGAGVNIGAGTIICNYDGVNKHKTVIGNNVFVGSNSVLIAPVTLADNAFVAAGSAVNTDVPENSLAVGRGKQRNISGWKRPTKPE